ncbi:hypothetical protein GCM10023169_33780 [Georgenia halophila]|uniref:Uncharacterized protein n=1 Tax=Georgenia halophila TaxID=620889 RepID=A0ABP8LIJ7_9MICO
MKTSLVIFAAQQEAEHAEAAETAAINPYLLGGIALLVLLTLLLFTFAFRNVAHRL